MNYTDTQLKATLAKMLPEQIEFELGKLLWLEPIGPKGASFQVFVSDTELLHLCWLVEQELSAAQKCQYAEILAAETEVVDWGYYPGEASIIEWDSIAVIAMSAWQQRTIALAKVKGIEI